MKNQQGLTLLEVLLSLTLLSIFAIAFGTIITNSTLWDNKNEERHNATILADFCIHYYKGNEHIEIQKLEQRMDKLNQHLLTHPNDKRVQKEVNDLTELYDIKQQLLTNDDFKEACQASNSKEITIEGIKYRLLTDISLVHSLEDINYSLSKIKVTVQSFASSETFAELDSTYMRGGS